MVKIGKYCGKLVRYGFQVVKYDNLNFRYGMTISCSGMKQITEVSQYSGYHQIKCGNQTLCFSISKLIVYNLHKFNIFIKTVFK